jgi:hypothetical protein
MLTVPPQYSTAYAMFGNYAIVEGSRSGGAVREGKESRGLDTFSVLEECK